LLHFKSRATTNEHQANSIHFPAEEKNYSASDQNDFYKKNHLTGSTILQFVCFLINGKAQDRIDVDKNAR